MPSCTCRACRMQQGDPTLADHLRQRIAQLRQRHEQELRPYFEQLAYIESRRAPQPVLSTAQQIGNWLRERHPDDTWEQAKAMQQHAEDNRLRR